MKGFLNRIRSFGSVRSSGDASSASQRSGFVSNEGAATAGGTALLPPRPKGKGWLSRGSMSSSRRPRKMRMAYTLNWEEKSEGKRSLSEQEIERLMGLAEDVLPGLLSEALGSELHDVEKCAEILGGHIQIGFQRGDSTKVLLQHSSKPRVGLCFETLDVLEQVVCSVEDGVDNCAAVNLPARLLACACSFYGVVINNDRTSFELIDVKFESDADDLDEELTASEGEMDTGESTEAETSETASRGEKLTPSSPQLSHRRICDRLMALLCLMMRESAVELSLLREPDCGLQTLFLLLEGTEGAPSVLNLINAVSEGGIPQVVLEAIRNSGSLTRWIDSFAVKPSSSTMRQVSSAVGLLVASCRTSQTLLDNFQDSAGYVMYYNLLCSLPDHTEDLLADLRQLVYLGPGFASAEQDAEHLGVVHSVFLARNEPAFAVIVAMLCRLEYEICSGDDEAREIIWKRHAFAWRYMAMKDKPSDEAALDDPNVSIESADLLRLPLLHCILTIYSSNPVNFGMLDEKFGVMSTLLVSLGASTSVHDEFLFMIAKLLELISMGMDYRPISLLGMICCKTLPQLLLNRNKSFKQSISREEAMLSFDLGTGDDRRSEGRNSSRLSSLHSASDLLHEFETPGHPGHSAAGSGDQAKAPVTFVMQVICQTLVKMVRSDHEYKDVLRESGLLSEALFPFIELASETERREDSEIFKMLPIWCTLLSDMIEENLTNEENLRDCAIHGKLYLLIPKEPNAVLRVMLQLARRDSGYIEQDVSALFDLLQRTRNEYALKIEILGSVVAMMRRNHSIKDLVRKLGGFEIMVTILRSLGGNFGEGESFEEDAVFLLEKLFQIFTVAMTGNHVVNREYVRDEIGYEKLADIAELVGILGSSHDHVLVDVILDCITEAIEILSSKSPSVRATVDENALRIRNVEPLAILTSKLSLLSCRGLGELLKRLTAMVHESHSEQAANCQILCETALPNLILSGQLFEHLLCDPNHEDHESAIILLGSLQRHKSSPSSLKELFRSAMALYGDGKTNAATAILRVINLAANPGNDDAFFCPYVQMSGPNDVLLLATGGDKLSSGARRVVEQPSTRSTIQDNAPGNIHVASLGKRPWPPSVGYTISFWIWLGKDVGEPVVLASMRNRQGHQLLRVTIEGNNIIKCRTCGPSPPSKSSEYSSGVTSQPASNHHDESMELRNAAILAAMAAAESTARIASVVRKTLSSKTRDSAAPRSTRERLVQDLSPHEVIFPSLHLDEGRWHHIVLVHRQVSNIGVILDKSLNGRMSLFVDGVEVSTSKFPFPLSNSNGGLKTSLFMGVDPIVSATRHPSDPVRFWRLGPMLMLDVPKGVDFAKQMYILGVDYKGTLSRTCATMRDARSFATVLLEQIFAYETETGSVVEHLERLHYPHDCWKDLLQTSSTLLNQRGQVDLESVVFSFSADRNTTLEGFKSIDTKSLIDRKIQEIDVPRTVLVNSTVTEPGQQQVVAVIGGGSFAVTPRPVGDVLRSVGGVSVVLRLLEISEDQEMTVRALQILRNVLNAHEANRFDFRQSNGHRILAWLLFGIAQRSKEIFTPQVFENMLKLAVLGEGSAALIADPEMLHQLILNHQVWRGGESSGFHRWRFVIIILQWLSNLVDSGNRNVELNLDALLALNIIDWALEIMLNLAIDIPPEDSITSDVLAAALQFLHNLNKQCINRRSLYELFKHIMVSLPYDVEDGEPASVPIRKSSEEGFEKQIDGDFESAWSASPPLSPKGDAIGGSAATTSSPRGRKKKRRRTVTDMMMRQSSKRSSRRLKHLASDEELSDKGEEILQKIRCMLFQLLLELPDKAPENLGDSEPQRRRMLFAHYSDILSIHWFSCLLSQSRDGVTFLLTLRLLFEMLQECEDFARHFIALGGFQMITGASSCHSELPSIILSLVVLQFGIPIGKMDLPVTTFEEAEERDGPHSTSDGRISSFVSAEAKRRLLTRKSTVEGKTRARVLGRSLVEEFNELVAQIQDISPPRWHNEVQGTLASLLRGLVRSSHQPRSLLFEDHSSGTRHWETEETGRLSVETCDLYKAVMQSFPVAGIYLASTRSIELLTNLIFEEASVLGAMDESSSPPLPPLPPDEKGDFAENSRSASDRFTGPVAQGVLSIYNKLMCLSVAENGPELPPQQSNLHQQQQNTQAVQVRMKDGRRLLETLMRSFPVRASPDEALWFQAALVQSLLPSFTLMLDDQTWAARESARSRMKLPFNADPAKVGSAVCYIAGKASFGWIPFSEHTVLELTLQAYRQIEMKDLKERILRCTRGLVLWSLDVALLNKTTEDLVQLLQAVRRNFEHLKTDEVISSLLPGYPLESFKQYKDPYVSSNMIPSPIREIFNLYDESVLFLCCLIHLALHHLKIAVEIENREIEELLTQVIGRAVSVKPGIFSKDEMLSDGVGHLLSGAGGSGEGEAAFLSWFRSLIEQRPDMPSPLWLGMMWKRVREISLFGSPEQCGLNSPEVLINAEKTLGRSFPEKRKLLHIEVEFLKQQATDGFQDTKAKGTEHILDANYEETSKNAVNLVRARKRLSSIELSRQTTDNLQHDAKKLITSTQEEAVERHRRWQRVGLEHLLRGRRCWTSVSEGFLRSVHRELFILGGHEAAVEETNPFRGVLHHRLDDSEGQDRMRRRLEAHLDFPKRFCFVGVMCEGDEEAMASSPDSSAPPPLKLASVNGQLASAALFPESSKNDAAEVEIEMTKVFKKIRQPSKDLSGVTGETQSRLRSLTDPGTEGTEEEEEDEMDTFGQEEEAEDENGADDEEGSFMATKSPEEAFVKEDDFALAPEMDTGSRKLEKQESMKLEDVMLATASEDGDGDGQGRGQSEADELGRLDSGNLSEAIPREEEAQEFSIEEEMNALGWQHLERVRAELEPCDQRPEHIINCSDISGMESYRGVCLICKSSLYFLSNYQVLNDGKLEEVQPDRSSMHCFDVIQAGPYIRIVQVSLPRSMSQTRLTPQSRFSDDSKRDDVDRYGTQVSHEARKLRFDNVREIYRRRYMFSEVGLEFFAVDGMNFLLVFESSAERDFVFTKILSKELPNLLLSKTTNMQVLVESSLASPEGLSLGALMVPWRRFRATMTKKWLGGELSNFSYLMYLNTLAGRSHNDLTQYPVFPWVLREYEAESIDLNDPASYRDLSKPMGALDEERAETFRERYEALASAAHETQMQPFHYGTHYSCSAYVLQFLIRLEPYASMALELQGGQFDRPDRIFHSFISSWRSVSGHDFNAQDVRELIPEFFYLPEFLTNMNKFDFGKTQRGKQVDDVELPAWSKNDPQYFIRMHRRALESRFVSEHLHEWIDLIFGYKQRGRAAIEAQNVFHPLTYEGEVNPEDIEDPMLRKATLAQIHNFGQTPRKLFPKPHPKRSVPAIDPDRSIALVDASDIQWHSHMAPPLVIPGSFNRAKQIDSWQFALKTQRPGEVALKKVDSGVLHRVLNGQGRINELVIIPSQDKVVAISGNTLFLGPSTSSFVSWGTGAGVLHVHSGLSSALTYGPQTFKIVATFESLHSGRITCCSVSDEGKEIWTGGTDSVVAVWKLRRSKSKVYSIEEVQRFASHTAPVTCLATSQVQGVAISGSEDKNAVAWDLEKKRFLRKLGPLCGQVMGVSINEANSNLLTLAETTLDYWHINGARLASITLDVIMRQEGLGVPASSLAMNCDDYQDGVVAVTGHVNGTIALWDIPEEPGVRNFCLRAVLYSGVNHTITALATDKEQRRLACGLENGTTRMFASAEILQS